MSVDLSLILPNDCHNIYDNAHALEIFNKTIAQIKAYFGGREGFIDDIRIYNSDSPDWKKYCSDDSEPEDGDSDIDDECVEYSFSLPIINATCFLKQGYWDIWVMSRYSTYFYPYSKDINGNIYLWPRKDSFNIARIFGFSEGWICDEFHSWNSWLNEDRTANFQKWCTYGEDKEDAEVYEFDLSMFGGRMDRDCDYHSKYHDNFQECHDLVATYERMYPEYKILTIGRPLGDFALVCKDKDLYILNLKTGERLLPFPIDCCHADFNGAGFTVSKGNEKAFFNGERQQLTDFRAGDFSWYWLPHDYNDQAVIDHASGRHFNSEDGTDIPEHLRKK